MTQRDLDHEVARATGESLNTIRNFGFSLVEPDDSGPLTVDWEEIDDLRLGLFPRRKTRRRLPAAA